MRCIDLVENILKLREQLADPKSQSRPLFIWEPVPDLCISSELDNCLKALQYVDVVSPNHGELGGFFGKDTNGKDGHVDYQLIESLSSQWISSGIGPSNQGGIVVRCGKDGCFVSKSDKSSKWLPAFHQSADKVIDPTGGGNGFLGGLAIGLVRIGSQPGVEHLEEAAIWASIAASFAIEQVGMPVLARGKEAQGETWNGVVVENRIADFKERLKTYIQR